MTPISRRSLDERKLYQMAARICRKTHVIKQTQKMIPFITCEMSLCQYVCELAFGVNTFELDFRVQVASVKQPIKSDSVSSRHMSHRGTMSFDYHLDHGFDVFKDVQLRFHLRRTCVGGYAFHFAQLINSLFSIDTLGLGFGITNCRVGLNILKFP